MAFDPSPTGYFPSWEIMSSGSIASSSGVFISFDDFDTYNSATTGDVRQLLYSFIEAYTDEHLSLVTADRPSQVTITRTSSVPSEDVLRKTFSITVNLLIEGVTVADES
jgi:hypothetical protein